VWTTYGGLLGHDRPARAHAFSFRADDDLWAAAKEVAAARHEAVSDVLRRALIHYVRRHQTNGAELRDQGNSDRRRRAS
jgi:predicted transcriptional regulator